MWIFMSREMTIQRKEIFEEHFEFLEYHFRKSNYDVRSAHPGNQEQIIIESPVPGRYFIVLYGYETYSMIGFEAEYR